MKVKHSVIPFIPVFLAMLGFKLASLFFLDSAGYFLGMNGMTISYLVIGLALGLFLLCVLINIIDKKTAQVYAVKKNYIAGAMAILSGCVIAGSSFIQILNRQTEIESEFFLMNIITTCLAIVAAIALVLMAKVHFSGLSTVSGVSVIYIFPSLWGCAKLVSEFLNATKVSVAATDMTALFCYIFITLYFFSHSMIVSKVKGRNPVKACFIYGLPAAALSITYGVYRVLYALRAVENIGFSTVVEGLGFAIIGVYIVSFIFEMSRNTLSKDEVEIIDNMAADGSDDELAYASNLDYDDLVFSETPDVKHIDDKGVSEYMTSVEGLDDFIMGYQVSEQDEPVPYLTKKEMENTDDFSSMFITTNDNEQKLIKQKKKKVKNEQSSAEKVTVAETEELTDAEKAEVKEPEQTSENKSRRKPEVQLPTTQDILPEGPKEPAIPIENNINNLDENNEAIIQDVDDLRKRKNIDVPIKKVESTGNDEIDELLKALDEMS